jgi:hypothetical protein
MLTPVQWLSAPHRSLSHRFNKFRNWLNCKSVFSQVQGKKKSKTLEEENLNKMIVTT